jgi:hypothetical protein
MLFAGTPEFVFDTVRGLYSYGALRQRLSANEFKRAGLQDTASPVIELEPLSVEDLWVLLENVHRVYCSNNQRDPLPDLEKALKAFLDRTADQLGGLGQVTPREATRSWLQFLDILDQNRREDWLGVLGTVAIRTDDGEPNLDVANGFSAFTPVLAQAAPAVGAEELQGFRL